MTYLGMTQKKFGCTYGQLELAYFDSDVLVSERIAKIINLGLMLLANDVGITRIQNFLRNHVSLTFVHP